jgi:hypothetical protein
MRGSLRRIEKGKIERVHRLSIYAAGFEDLSPFGSHIRSCEDLSPASPQIKVTNASSPDASSP